MFPGGHTIYIVKLGVLLAKVVSSFEFILNENIYSACYIIFLGQV